MTRAEAEQIFNDLCAHYLGIRPDSVRASYLDKLQTLDAESCAEACAMLPVRSKRFPTLADIFEATAAVARRRPRDVPTVNALTGHPDGPFVPREEAVRRLRAIITKLGTPPTQPNPFLTPEEVRRIHERWSPAVRARRISGCACCELYRTKALREATELMEPSREVGIEG